MHIKSNCFWWLGFSFVVCVMLEKGVAFSVATLNVHIISTHTHTIHIMLDIYISQQPFLRSFIMRSMKKIILATYVHSPCNMYACIVCMYFLSKRKNLISYSTRVLGGFSSLSTFLTVPM